MRLFCISDSDDAVCGLRLAGVGGELVKNAEEAERAVEKAALDKDIGIILINRSLFAECDGFLHEFKKKHGLPLVIEIPDTSGMKGGDSIARYVREAVGIKD